MRSVRAVFGVGFSVLVLGAGVFCSAAKADTLVSDLTSTWSNINAEFISPPQAAYAPFTLTSAVSVDSATVSLYTEINGQYMAGANLSLVNSVAGQPGSTVYGTTTGAGVQTGATSNIITFSFASPVSLAAGSYFLEMTGSTYLEWTETAEQQAYGQTGPFFVSTGADGYAINQLIDTHGYTEGDAFLFSLNGSGLSATPEPGSLALLATGMLGGAGVVRRRLVR